MRENAANKATKKNITHQMFFLADAENNAINENANVECPDGKEYCFS